MSLNGAAWKPLSIGRILDYSAQLAWRHYVKLFLITLIFIGPALLLYQIMLPEFSYTSVLKGYIDEIRSGITPDNSLFSEDLSDSDALWFGIRIISAILLATLYSAAAFPVYLAIVIYFVGDVYAGRTQRSIGSLVKQAFSRFWNLVGSSLLYGLILFGISTAIYIAVVVIVIIVALIGGTFVGILSNGSSDLLSTSGIAGAFIIIILLFYAALFGIAVIVGYFGIRFSYYLPLVALKEESIGLGKSWALTRKSFWRLFAAFLVVYLIVGFIGATLSVAGGLLGLVLPRIFTIVISLLTSLVLFPLFPVTYAVTFFDLKTRKEGRDLEALIEQTTQAEHVPAANFHAHAHSTSLETAVSERSDERKDAETAYAEHTEIKKEE